MALLLPAILVPTAVSFVTLKIVEASKSGSAVLVFLVVLTPVLVFVPLALFAIHTLNQMERERRQSEEELRISTQRFSGVVASAMDAIITLDESQRIIVFNKAAERMFGCPAWDVLGKPLDRFLPTPLRGSHSEHIRRFGEAGITTRSMNSPAMLHALRANGEQFPIEATISQVQIAGQKLYTVILRDVTERKRAEETLRQSEARFRSIYEQAAVGIEQVALDGQLLMVNPALCNMLGYKQSDLLSKNTAEITHPDDHERELELFRAMQGGERQCYEIEKRYRHRNGSTVWAHVTSSIVNNAAGDPQYRISVVQNVTERKRAEDQLKQSQKMEAIGRLAGGVAHDFNTLLNVMLGYSEMLLAELPEGDERRERVLQIKNSGEAAAMLTRQLLTFSRKQAVSSEVVDLRDIATKITPMLGRLLRDDIALAVSCSEDVCRVKVDPGQIQQVVLNLVANAADAMPNGGRLDIRVETVQVDPSYMERHPSSKVGRFAQLTVRDTGTGMSPATAAHIFEPFYTTKDAGQGTGLGLATVYGIVKRSGGDVWVNSEPGAGTVFKVLLPLSEEPMQAEESKKVAAPIPSCSGETILLVEDSAALRELTKVILMREGYKVLEAEDGVAALELSRGYPSTIHLVLTDVVMPRMRGPEMAKEIVKQRPEVAVVFLSGYTEEVITQSDSITGFILVEKPYTAPALLQALRRALDENSTRNPLREQHRSPV